MRVGDPILIYRNKNFEYYAFVTYKIHNAGLAKHLWAVNGKGRLGNILSEVSVPIEIFNGLVGYQRHYIPQGFGIVGFAKTAGYWQTTVPSAVYQQLVPHAEEATHPMPGDSGLK